MLAKVSSNISTKFDYISPLILDLFRLTLFMSNSFEIINIFLAL